MSETRRPTVAIAGATGYVGKALVEKLLSECQIVGLCRRLPKQPKTEGLKWVSVDLYALPQLEQALEGVDVAVYLVHSMLPSDRLTQAKFEDLDVILADNFGRACRKANVKHIVYLGGLIPNEQELQGHPLSRHLLSRKEVEDTLAAHGVPVTTLRAGLIVGPEGSSFQMLRKLVQRLPVMLCPAWTLTPTQPISLSDVLTLLHHVILHPESQRATYDVGGPDVLSYRQMMKDVGAAMGRRRWLLPVPFFTTGLSRLWVTLVTGFPKALVAPLVASLRHPMVAHEKRLQARLGLVGQPWKEAVTEALRAPLPQATSTPNHRSQAMTVKSVQRLDRGSLTSAQQVAEAYLRFLPNLFKTLIRVDVAEHRASFRVFFLSKPLLVLEAIPTSDVTRAVLHVVGGILWRPSVKQGQLEFRFTADGHGLVMAIHDFVPRLPWYIYRYTQAILHVWVSHAFGRHLKQQLPIKPSSPS